MIRVTTRVGHDGALDGHPNTWQPGAHPFGGYVVEGIQLDLQNLSEKTIKYCNLYYEPHNQVGDLVSGQFSEEVEVQLTAQGPLGRFETSTYQWPQIWQTDYVDHVVLTKAEILYMDGTEEVIQGKQIEPIPVPEQKSGCYVATAVYGSYDCPEVWTLRRYRDQQLAMTWVGRKFIRFYYATSPGLVRHYGSVKWIRKICRTCLDGVVRNLKRHGFKDTPYVD